MALEDLVIRGYGSIDAPLEILLQEFDETAENRRAAPMTIAYVGIDSRAHAIRKAKT
jgi:hypothetical protein